MQLVNCSGLLSHYLPIVIHFFKLSALREQETLWKPRLDLQNYK